MVGGLTYREWAGARKFKKCEPKNPWNKEVADLYFNKWSYFFKSKDEDKRWAAYRQHLIDESSRVIKALSLNDQLVVGEGAQAIALETKAPVNPYELVRQIYDIYQSDLYVRPDKSFNDALGQRFIDFLENVEYHGSYETAAGYIDKGDVVFDIGAGYGVFTLLALIQGARGVHAFEPNAIAGEVFVNNMLLNGVGKENLRFSPVAVTNSKERKNLVWEEGYPCSGRIVRGTKAERLAEGRAISTLDCISLDNYISLNKINKVDFIKISSPNYELGVLEGAINTLTKHKPKLSVEVGYDAKTEKQVVDFIEQIDPQYVCQKRAFKVQASISDD